MSKFTVVTRTIELRGRYENTQRKTFNSLTEAEDYMQRAIEAIEAAHYVTYSDESGCGVWLIEYDPKMQTTLRIVAA